MPQSTHSIRTKRLLRELNVQRSAYRVFTLRRINCDVFLYEVCKHAAHDDTLVLKCIDVQIDGDRDLFNEHVTRRDIVINWKQAAQRTGGKIV